MLEVKDNRRTYGGGEVVAYRTSARERLVTVTSAPGGSKIITIEADQRVPGQAGLIHPTRLQVTRDGAEALYQALRVSLRHGEVGSEGSQTTEANASPRDERARAGRARRCQCRTCRERIGG